MPRVGFADRQKLKSWADTVGSQAELPRLVRRLILETTPDLTELGMPADEGVAAGSWDGSARATTATPWVPDGLSVWELSVNSSPGTKADDDYKKRLTTPDGSPTTDCVYVEAILRPWTQRDTWAKDRTADGRWRSVRAYGLDDLHLWLEAAPVTWAWFSEVLGLNPHGLRSAEAWWDSWSAQTSPHVTTDVVLAGRDDAVNALVGRVFSGGITTVAGASIDETCAFIAAVGVRQDAAGDGKLLSRTAFVDDLTTWRSLLLEAKTPLVLVPLLDGLAKEVPSGCIHHIVVPVSTSAAVDIELPPVASGEVAAALAKAGVTDEKLADELGRLARRSLTALRRRIATKPALHAPEWAKSPVSRLVRACLLACGWSEQSDGDKQVVADFAGSDYEQTRDALATVAQIDDPLVQRLASTWHLVSPYDAWLLLRDALSEDDMKRLEAAVNLVLGESDPSLDLPPDDRWKASLEGKVRSYSSDFRRGLTKTMALLGTHGAFVIQPSGASGESWARHLVRGLLDPANADPTGDTWKSIATELPLLAEAAPQVVIDALRAGLKGDDPVLAGLFGDAEPVGIFGSSSHHSHLLWTLETLAWSPDHFGAAVDLLARLDEVDPGGKLANRPAASLAGIFCPWHPSTSASADSRVAAVDGLIDRHNETAWRLLLSMLPEVSGVHFPTAEPTYRDWKVQEAVTYAEYFAVVTQIVQRAISDAALDQARWRDLIKRMPHLPPADRKAVTAALEAHNAAEDFDHPTRTMVWSELSEIVRHHRGFADTDWALPPDEIDDLEKLSGLFAPTDPYEVNRWLFMDYHPDIGGPSLRDDYGAHEEAIAEARREAVQAIEADGGLPALVRMSGEAKVPGSVGWALAAAVGDKYGADLLPAITSPDNGEQDLAHSYLARRFQDDGWTWLDPLLAAHSELNPEQLGKLLVLTRDYPTAWEKAESRGPEVAEQFWRHFPTFGLGGDFAHVEMVAERLMGVGRNAAAVDFLNLYLRHGESDPASLAILAARGLDALIHSTDDPEIAAVSAWDYEQLFVLLERHRETVSEDVVARLEWLFLPGLGLEPQVPTLHTQMAASPSFFVEVLSTVYGSADSAVELSEQERAQRQARATNGYRLLSSWGDVPGLVDGAIDPTSLKAWIDEIVDLLSDTDRVGKGMNFLGQALVSAPADPDGSWPPQAVRDLFEDLQDDSVEGGFSAEVWNRRGVTTRGLEDGGVQERELMAKFQSDAEAFKDRWPRTAAILRGIADSYDRDARRNEDEAERFRRGLES